MEEIQKHFALMDEMTTSHSLIKSGLGEIQNINSKNNFYFLHFQLLAQGFERFMKCYICLGYLNEQNTYPSYNQVKNLGHDLEKLLKKILNIYFQSFQNTFQYAEDKKFLEENEDLKKLLSILSEFGKGARYYNFDVITGKENTPLDTKSKWKEFESDFIFADKRLFEKVIDFESGEIVYETINRYIVILFERFVSALSRQFIFNCLGEKALQLSVNTFHDFGMLYENDFGNTDYRKNTTRFKNKEVKIHERTLTDKLNSKFKYKSKLIKREEYKGKWCFYSDSVVLERRGEYWCVAIIDDCDYALNGPTQKKFNIPSPHDKGMAILGMSTSEFMDIALSLK